jgi:hypothetical protein
VQGEANGDADSVNPESVDLSDKESKPKEKEEDEEEHLKNFVWREGVTFENKIEVYEALDIVKHAMSTKDWRAPKFWLVKMHHALDILFWSFYRNLVPFLVLVVPSIFYIRSHLF